MSQKYLEEVLCWVGTKEIPGKVANPDIVMFSNYTAYHVTSDEIPWCSQFANFIVHKCGDEGTDSAAAISWLKWGKALATPTPGCIVIIDRKDPNNPDAAHVGFYVCDGKDPQSILVIGGNQSDMVKPQEFKRSRVLGYRDAKS